MKISSDIIGKRNHKLPVCGVCLKYPRYYVINRKKRDRYFLFFVQPNIHYRVHSGLLLAFVLLSISAVHILTSHTFKIHINTIVQSTHITYT